MGTENKEREGHWKPWELQFSGDEAYDHLLLATFLSFSIAIFFLFLCKGISLTGLVVTFVGLDE